MHSSSFTISTLHPSLAGHFPDHPIVPGVVVLDEVVGALKKQGYKNIIGFSQVKFVQPLLPEQLCHVEYEQSEKSSNIKFTCRVNDVVISRGSIIMETHS